ncbi:MAG: FAD-binding oxidoreductase [Candidatus Methylomirabilia bacterium]
MAVSAPALGEALAGIVSPRRLISDPPALFTHAVEGTPPRWVAYPERIEEVGALLSLAFEERLAVIPRGTGERMGLGNLPARVDLVVDCSRLSAVVDYQRDDLTVTVQAGMTLNALAARLAARNQFLPLDPPGGRSRTVGGLMATGDAGPLRFRYGTARDLLLGARFVQANGTITWGGAKVVKSVSGYDVPKLLVGSLGSLGILAELTLRLHPLPEREGQWLVGFPSVGQAKEFLASILDSFLQPSRVELLNGGALSVLEAPPSPASVAVTVGSIAEAVRSQGEALLGFAARCGGHARALPAGEFWHRLGQVLDPAGGVLLKVVTLPALTLERLSAIDELARSHALNALVVAEAGDGVLHVRLSGRLSPEEWERSVILPLRATVAPEDGSVVVEAAPRALKERLDVWGPIDPAALAIMKRLKAEFDSRGILNPGRFVDRI